MQTPRLEPRIFCAPTLVPRKHPGHSLTMRQCASAYPCRTSSDVPYESCKRLQYLELERLIIPQLLPYGQAKVAR